MRYLKKKRELREKKKKEKITQTNKAHLKEYWLNLVFLADYDGLNGEDSGIVFNVNRSTISRALKKKPKRWKPKKIKI